MGGLALWIRRTLRRRGERGSIIALTSLSMVMMVGVSAIVVDLSNARQISRQAQAAADSASLAGAQELMISHNWTTTVDRVKTYSKFNTGLQTLIFQPTLK